MEDLNINVAKGFGLRWKYITKEKASYLCHTDSGVKVIKKTASDHRHIVFQHRLKTQLCSRGFNCIDMYGLSVQNLPYFEYNNETYVMTDRISGRMPDFQNMSDFKKLLFTTAALHKQSRGFQTEEAASFSKNSNIKEVFSRQIQEMAAIKKKLKKRGTLSDFDVTFIKNYDYYYSLMLGSFEMIKSSKLDLAAEGSRNRAFICHNLLKEENFFLYGEDLFTTNFSECSFDSCVFDLAEIIRRYMKNLPESYIPISEIINIYTSFNPLDGDELAVLKPLISFPGKFVKLCMQHYVKNRSFVPSALNARMKNLIDRQQLTDEYLKTF